MNFNQKNPFKFLKKIQAKSLIKTEMNGIKKLSINVEKAFTEMKTFHVFELELMVVFLNDTLTQFGSHFQILQN